MGNNYKLIDNTQKKQYEIHFENHIAKLEYIKSQDKIFLTHTEVPRQLGGKGIGSELVKMVLADVEKKDLTLVPLCPFVAQYIKKNPEWKKLVFKGINIA